MRQEITYRLNPIDKLWRAHVVIESASYYGCGETKEAARDELLGEVEHAIGRLVKFLGFDLKRFPDRWISDLDCVREIGGVIVVFEDPDSIVGSRWKAALDYGDNLRLMASAPTLADAEEDMRVKLRAVVRWSLRAIEGKVPVWTAEEIEDVKKRGDEMFERFGQKEPVHSCLACGYGAGRAVNRNEPPLHRLAVCPNVDPRIREDAAERLARRSR